MIYPDKKNEKQPSEKEINEIKESFMLEKKKSMEDKISNHHDNGVRMTRTLKKGEIIQAADESLDDDGVWKPVRAHMVGREASDPAYMSHSLYRRRVEVK